MPEINTEISSIAFGWSPHVNETGVVNSVTQGSIISTLKDKLNIVGAG
jgi:hypothetical protein